MRLLEEYIKRHNINFLPVYHVSRSNIILKRHSRPQIVLNIKWEEEENRPGYYTFNYFSPNHNGYLNEKYFTQLNENNYYKYNEYASFIMRWVKNLDFTPVEPNHVKLAIWEMFLLCFDSWIAKNNLEESVFAVIDLSLTEAARFAAIDNFFDYLKNHHHFVWEIYNFEFQKHEYNYADWLVELIKRG